MRVRQFVGGLEHLDDGARPEQPETVEQQHADSPRHTPQIRSRRM
jgi:hypothetical protein